MSRSHIDFNMKSHSETGWKSRDTALVKTKIRAVKKTWLQSNREKWFPQCLGVESAELSNTHFPSLLGLQCWKDGLLVLSNSILSEFFYCLKSLCCRLGNSQISPQAQQQPGVSPTRRAESVSFEPFCDQVSVFQTFIALPKRRAKS